ncbi:MAG: rhamnulokinase [Bacteroidales bacterium]|nr:rhamnulokinase [Bacteroidales bacterium]
MDYLALDLGAASGRAIVGSVYHGKIRLDEVHRFTNKQIKVNNTLYWDILHLFDHIKQGISAAFKKGYNIQGLAVDTWGVDFGFIDARGNLISNPVSYRDNRTRGMQDLVSEILSGQELYSRTGIQQIDINTLYQLYSLKKGNDPCLQIAHKLLFTPDLINYFLTGIVSNEYTIASTSQLLDAGKRKWDITLLEKLGFPLQWLSSVTQPGTILGHVKKEIAEKLNIHPVKVFAVGSHDTASAIGAIPLDENTAFLSSGTWSLLGIPLDEPILTEEANQNNFSNEGGIDNKILFMRNITGLWLFQQLIIEWEESEDTKLSYEYLLEECDKAVSFRSIVDSDHASFHNPASMKKAIREYCRQTRQPIPETKGELVRCVLESLALKYCKVMQQLKDCTQKEINKLFIVGGGSLNKTLNQFIANALNMEVITGITEATAIGNIIQQAIANEEINNLSEGHRIIENSFNFVSYQPQDHPLWLKETDRLP